MKKALSLVLVLLLSVFWLPALADGYADMLEKAQAYLSDEDYSKALAAYQLALQLNPDDETAYLGEATARIALEDYSEAAAVVDAVLSLNPVSAEAWRMKCRLDILLGHISAFEEDSIFAEVCGADLSDLSSLVGAMYAGAGANETALTYFERSDLSALDEAQREKYRKALISCGRRADAEALGLMPISVRNDALDAAFDSGDLTLVETTFPTVAVEDFEFPEDLWIYAGEKPMNPYAELADFLPEYEPKWLSLSPAGNSGILVIDECVIGYYSGKYHILFPSVSRGVEDANGNLEKIYSAPIHRLLSEEGVIYSPDGRYAAIFNYQTTLMKMQMIFDPIVIDLSTGEMILTATYGNKPKDGFGAVSTAVFSEDGRYLYYMLYGNTTAFKTSLWRYDLESQQTEQCYSGSDFNYFPSLSETADGAFLMLRDTLKKDEYAGLTRMALENGSWKAASVAFDLPLGYWAANRLLSSPNSGFALILSRLNSTYIDGHYLFQAVRPDEAFFGLNRYCAISKEDNQVVTFSADVLRSLEDEVLQDVDDYSGRADIPFRAISTAALSPDGQYVLMLVSDSATEGDLLLVRLDDLSVREVRGIEATDIVFLRSRDTYAPVIEWHTDTLIVNTRDGVRAFRFRLS